MNTRKILLCVTALSMLFSTLTACGQKNDNAADNNTVGQSDTAKKTTIRFLNFKPEVASVYDEVAAKYKEETGKLLQTIPMSRPSAQKCPHRKHPPYSR